MIEWILDNWISIVIGWTLTSFAFAGISSWYLTRLRDRTPNIVD